MLGGAYVRKRPDLMRLYSEVTFSYHNQLDLTDQYSATKFLNKLMPDVIINCAAMTIVEDCEKYPDKAAKINTKLPQLLAAWVKTNGKKLVHYSTDAVFDGKKGNYVETDQPNPLNTYAKTKLAGEKLVLAANPISLVIRTNIIGIRGHKPYPLAEWMLLQLKNNKEFATFTDVIFAPICVDDVVDFTLVALKKNLSGLYHLNARDHVSKHEFAQMLALEFGYRSPKLIPIKSSQILTVTRPEKTYLNSQKFTHATGKLPPTVHQSINELRKYYQNATFAKDEAI